MARRFVIDSPADLAAMDAAGLVRSGRLMNTAKVWSATKKQGKTAFDGRIFIMFDSSRQGPRHAIVYRVGIDEEIHEMAELKYNTALKWCEMNLRPVA